MSKILVTGSTGLLGTTLVPQLKNSGYEVITHARKGEADFLFDLSEKTETCIALNEINPEIIINLVGLTSVEMCEENPNYAYLSNTHTVENLVSWINGNKRSCYLLHISTDHIYDGTGSAAEENIKLTNYYAFSKFAGELAALGVPNHVILRTNFFGKSMVPHRESITDWVFDVVTGRKNVEVLDDVYFSPLSMSTLGEMILHVLEKRPVGIYNLGSHDGMSKAEFDYYFAECLGFQSDTMVPVKSKNASFLKAYRPKDMRMDCSRFERDMKITLPILRDEIQKVAGKYKL